MQTEHSGTSNDILPERDGADGNRFPRQEPIAIIGMACRFPGSKSLSDFWRLLINGENAVIKGPPGSVIGRAGQFQPNSDVTNEALRFGAHLQDIDQFDAEFFRISPIEAELLDPQQRMMLETSWQALEDAGIDPESLRDSRTGIYAGISIYDYREATIDAAETSETAAGLYAVTGTALNTAIGRVSYAFGLEGPAMAIDTACSSSLVAVQQAIGGLQRREANLALAGGVNVHLSGRHLDLRANAGMLSPTGQCHTFDESADGFVCGEGCGLVVLKRLSEAEADGDRIWAVIRGTSVNQDGASQGLTVPSGVAQARAMEEALVRAGVSPSEIDYLETHGTGTVVGDPIEVSAAAAVYRQGRDPDNPVLIGSVKTNIGHLGPAAGVAGLVKAVLSMRHGVIPRHLNFETPNPRIDWNNLPVRVTDAITDWPSHPNRAPLAAVNSFGWSGTNAHVVVEGYDSPETDSASSRMSSPEGPARPVSEAPQSERELGKRETRVLPLSGKTPGALRDLASSYLSWVDEHAKELSLHSTASGETLSDMAWTAAMGRSHFSHRAGIAFSDADALREKLLALSDGEDQQDSTPPREATKVAFVFTGQGSQWAGMGRELYEREPVFRAVLDRCDWLLFQERGISLLDVMFGRVGTDGLLDEPAWTQPAIYSLECALVALWESVGVRPDVVVGHSLGEIAASQTAGAFTLEEGLRFAAARGALLGATRADGAMAAVFAPASLVTTAVTEHNSASDDVGLSVAVDNGVQQVVSGPGKDLEAVLELLEADGVKVSRLRRSPAYHSALVEPALDELEAAVRDIVPAPPALSLPLISNMTGRALDQDQRMDGAYWRQHARQPVAFRSCVETLAEMNVDAVVEIGPHAVLGPLVSMTWPGSAPAGAPAVLQSLRRPPRDVDGPLPDTSGGFVEAAAGAYAAGLDINFAGLFAGESRRRVSVPGYPFQRSRYWVPTSKRRQQTAGHPLLGARHESPRGDVMFEAEMFSSDPAWLMDHLVYGQVVAPGGMYGAMAVSAFFADRNGPAAVDEMQTHSPLIFQENDTEDGDNETGRRVQFVLDGPADASTRRFEIHSKGESEEGWTLHAEGSLSSNVDRLDEAGPIDVDRLKAELQPVDTAEFYRNRYSEEISLGPAYRTIRAVWSRDGQALGELALRDSVDASGMGLHPLLLDGCFQVLSVARYLSGVERGAVYMPFGWEQLWVAGPMPERIVCHAVLRNPPSGAGANGASSEPPEVVTGDVGFYSLDGSPLGGLIGFTVKRATRAALLSANKGLKDLLYEVVWREKPLSPRMAAADFLTSPAQVVARSQTFTEHLANEGVDVQDRAVLLEDLERLSQAYTLSGLERLGWERKVGAEVSPESLRSQLKVSDVHRRLFGRLLGLLSEAGILSPADEGFVIDIGADDQLPDQSLADPEALAEHLVDKHPYGINELGLLRRCGAALAEVLQGRSDPLSLLFSDEGASAADLYLKAPASLAANKMLGEAVAATVSDLPEDRRLRVLEVGAGTGSATEAILPHLPSDRLDYTYTDISAGFFAQAEERLAETGAPIDYKPLNIESEPVGQGFEPHSYDLVIAANVLHATRDLGETLTHCCELLAPSGQLIALEALRRRSWQDLTFGLLDGWWRFDDSYRPDHALATPTIWRRALTDVDFSEVEFLGTANPDTDEPVGSSVIIAQGPADVAPSPGIWVIAADANGMAAKLAVGLASRNQTAVVASEKAASGNSTDEIQGVTRAFVDASHREDWQNLLIELPKDAPLKGVVHLEALDGHGVSASVPEMAEDVTHAAASALALVQGILDADVTPTQGVWFVTRGGQVLEHDQTTKSSGELAGATLWGFGKVIARESGHLQPRLIDLDPMSGETTTDVLIDEILFPDQENHVAYREGSRHAARLVRGDFDNKRPPIAEDVERDASRTPPLAEEGLRGDRTYLVTGGLGGIGCAVARWLAENGAGTIVLNGRRDPDLDAEETVRELREGGADVRVELADITDASAVDDMLSRIDKAMPPLGGVIHSVGVLSDGAIENQTWERFEQVLWPKVLGAWHLHRATIDSDLDMFVLFSSITGVLGNAGQANHAAANSYLDQLAAHRRSLGLPGQAIAWGAWSDIGEAAEQRERIERQVAYTGTGWLTPQQGIQALDWLVRQDVTASTVTAADWAVVAEELETPAPFLEDLLITKTASVRKAEEQAPSSNLLAQLREASADQHQGLLVSFVQQELKAVLRMTSQPSPTVSFFDLGVDSLMAVELRNRINRALAGEYTASNTVIFDYPTAASLASFLSTELGALSGLAPTPQPMLTPTPSRVRTEDEPIAIVGMACRFPGAPDIEAFWRQLEEGRNAVTEGRSDPGSWDGVLGDPAAEKAIYRRGAFVEGIDLFDAGFFQIAPIEARLMDPQHRMLLETTWQVLEDAGIDPEQLRGSRTGVFAGVGGSGYRDLVARSGQGYSYSGTGESMAVGRVAFTFGLEGPAMPLDMACASSLAAVHQAVVSLQRGEVDMALAGGVNATLSPAITEFLTEMGMLSTSGQCNAFDASADGYVRGEGSGMVALKRLSDAEADGDRIWGVVLGTGVNQNGMSAGLMAPNGPAQERAMQEALTRAGVVPSAVDYLEAQGVGSEYGDPIEMNAVANVYGKGRDPEQPLVVGSVKTNIGHLEWASGVASLIKTVLAMRHGVIPRHLHFKDPSPLLDWDRLPVRVASEVTTWPSGANRLPLAAVNTFGLSGTNAHIVVAGYQDTNSSNGAARPEGAAQPVSTVQLDPDPAAVRGGLKERDTRFLPLSGKSPKALRELAQRYSHYLDEQLGHLSPDATATHPVLADMVWTAGVGRSHFSYRAGIAFSEVAQLRQGLAELASKEEGVADGQLDPHSSTEAKAAFVYTGQDDPWLPMGQHLYETEPVFREVLDRCNELLIEERGVGLLDLIFRGDDGQGEVNKAAAIYAMECGLTALWKSVGVNPGVVVGHGLGKIAAAQASGAISLEEGLRLALAHSRDGDKATPDGPANVFSGLDLSPLSVTLVDGANGQTFQPGGVLDDSYWSMEDQEPASNAAATLAELGVDVVIEMGPTSHFVENIRSSWPELGLDQTHQGPPVSAPSFGHPADSGASSERGTTFVDAVAKAYEAGLSIDFTGLFAGESRRRVSIPGYPFQRRRHWVDEPTAKSPA